ncbi:MerR family transcriptional regulator [Streptomyces sp. NPDC050560]|uniref:MerR family transcriptional regulator n=1 Tax=Streptomyces sp. NPDC050560 TaxID=3365630 RepID=UPI0037B94F46
MDWHESGLTVGELAERMQVAPSAVRWYDDHGLLSSERTSANHRRFFADACCRIAMIRAAQRVGLTVAEIRTALEALPPGKVPTQRDWSRLAEHLRSVVGRRIDDLFRLMEELTPAEEPRSGQPAPSPGSTPS